MKKLLLCGKIDMNCYIIEYNNKCYIIDPGYEKEKVIDYIESNNLEVLGILLTHGHIDHMEAIDAFKVPVYIYEGEYQVFIDNYWAAEELFGTAMKYSLDDINLVQYDKSKKFEIDDKEITVIVTPGHTIGGVCYKFENDLYTGDTLFKGTVGKWIFKTGNLDDMKKSLFYLLENLDDNINVHPGHGDSSTIGEEKKSNRYYLEWNN